MDNYRFNIIGCIEQYQDFQTAIKWFERGKLELSGDNFSDLAQDIQGYFLQKHQFNNVEKLLHFEIIPISIRKILQETYDTELHRHREIGRASCRERV